MWFGGLHTIILKPGEGYAGEKPSIVSTVLGSCVSVTMFCRNGRFGAICHSLLPEAASGTAGNEFRYVDSSMYAMLLHFDRRGVPREELEVKLFGDWTCWAAGVEAEKRWGDRISRPRSGSSPRNGLRCWPRTWAAIKGASCFSNHIPARCSSNA